LIANGFNVNIFHTISNPQNMTNAVFESSGEKTIFLGSPFFGEITTYNNCPISEKCNILLLLDLNIVSSIRQRKNKKNISKLFEWVEA